MPIPKQYGTWVTPRRPGRATCRSTPSSSSCSPSSASRPPGSSAEGRGWRVTTSVGNMAGSSGGHRHRLQPHARTCRTGPTESSSPGRWSTPSAYREPSPYAGQRVLVVGSGNSAADVVVDLAGVAAEVIMAVRTPPNIIRRDMLGRAESAARDRVGPAAAADQEPDVGPAAEDHRAGPQSPTDCRPSAKDGFSQFRRTRTVPIIDCGFVDVVRSGRVRIVPAVEAFTEGGVRLVDGSQVEVDAVIAGDRLPNRARRHWSAISACWTSAACRWSPAAGPCRRHPDLHFIGDQGRADRAAAGDRDRVALRSPELLLEAMDPQQGGADGLGSRGQREPDRRPAVDGCRSRCRG